MNALTKDKFLGGAIEVFQPRDGYRAGIDPVLLAAACAAKPGESVLDLGLGVGVASLCLIKRTGAVGKGLELQDSYADLAEQNAAMNDCRLDVIRGDIRALPACLRQENFDHVIMNPPFFAHQNSTASKERGRDLCLRSNATIGQWISAATARLKPKGYLTLIHKASLLQDILASIDNRLGAITILPLAGRRAKPANRIILRARKASRGALVLCGTRILHHGAAHSETAQDYSAEFVNILQRGAALDF